MCGFIFIVDILLDVIITTKYFNLKQNRTKSGSYFFQASTILDVLRL